MTARRILDEKGGSVITAPPDMTLTDAARVLTEHRIGAVVICQPGDSTPLGVFSERDLARLVAEEGPSALQLGVSQVMSTDLVTADGLADVNALMELMTQRRVRHVLIVEAGALVGVVSIGDVVKRRIAEAEAEAAAMRSYIETA
ncbi:MAG: CBS domain-containing protein [Pseudomonadota bacterium]